MEAVELERTCAQCGDPKPADDFIGRRGRPVTYCSACRTKYYGGAAHVPGEENVGERRYRNGNSRSRLGLGARAKTESMVRLTKRELVAGRVHLQLLADEGIDVERPATRGDCVGGQRPCPWVSCQHNLYLDVDDATQSIKYNFPDLEADEVAPEKSCALDVADQGGGTLEDVATTMNVTRERIRQIESRAITEAKRRARIKGTAVAALREYSDAPDGCGHGSTGSNGGSVFRPKAERVDPEASSDDDEDKPPTWISFFAEPDSERADDLVTQKVWTMFARWQNGRGFECRSNQSRAQSKSVAERREAKGEVTKHFKEDTMTKDEFAAAHAAFKKQHGKLPTAKELFEAIGADAISVSNVRQAIKRAGLVLDGAYGSRARPKGQAAAKPRAAAKTARKSAPPPPRIGR